MSENLITAVSVRISNELLEKLRGSLEAFLDVLEKEDGFEEYASEIFLLAQLADRASSVAFEIGAEVVEDV